MTERVLLLAPGAGSDRNHSSLLTLEEALAPMPVARMDFSYRREGRKAPDRAPKLLAAVAEEVDALVGRTGIEPANLLMGGRSMGGRICSMAAAEGTPCAGLILICYPLHPTGKPDRLRIEHFPRLTMPCLFISGTRDPFGTPDEFDEHVRAIPGEVTQVWLEGKRHDLKGCDDEIVEAVQSWLA